MLAVVSGSPPLARALVVGAYVLAVEWSRAWLMRAPGAAAPALVLGGVALAAAAFGWPPGKLGLGWERLWLRVLGGLALGAVLLLPAGVRSGGAPLLPAGLAFAAAAVSIGEEVAFRGAMYSALEELGGAPVAVLGSTLLWTAAHLLSHPHDFLVAVFGAGLLLATWRWACRDLVGPVIGHVIADIAL